jgi:hypothetical protein
LFNASAILELVPDAKDEQLELISVMLISKRSSIFESNHQLFREREWVCTQQSQEELIEWWRHIQANTSLNLETITEGITLSR